MKPPLPLRINTPAHVASNFEGLVHARPRRLATLWKLVRAFDDPAHVDRARRAPPRGQRWPRPRHVPARHRSPISGSSTTSMHDPIEALNRWHDVERDSAVADGVRPDRRDALKAERARAVPERNHPWPYASRQPTAGPMTKTPPAPARAARALVQKLGMHPDDPDATIIRPRRASGRSSSRPTSRGSTSRKPTGCLRQ